jgi:hypothetical protein
VHVFSAFSGDNMIRALVVLAGIALAVSHVGATPPPPPGGYPYYNTAPITISPAGQLIDQSSQPFSVSTNVSEPFTLAGTLTTRVYQEPGTDILDFVYHITPATTGEMLHSLDVRWINNEVVLNDAGCVSTGTDAAPVTIARFNLADPVTFLFNFSLTPGDSNLDNGTADLVLKTDARVYAWSDNFTARTIDNGDFLFSGPIGGFVPEHAPEPASLSIAGIGALLVLQRRNLRA